MAISLYTRDSQNVVHRGAIYKFRPIPWLHSPLFILRNIRWTPIRQADMYSQTERADAFRLASEGNEEHVMARAKLRYIIVLSNDNECRQSMHKEVVVCPIYSLDPRSERRDFLATLQTDGYPNLFYLMRDPAFPEVGEAYLNFRATQAVHKEFLSQDSKLGECLTAAGVKAILQRYHLYMVV
jgi:hypothetical protein